MNQATVNRRLPIGAEVLREGGVHFRVWAPMRRKVAVLVGDRAFELAPEPGGYFSGTVGGAAEGSLYRYQLEDGPILPDPASRFQPEGPEGPSQIVDPSRFAWTDGQWRGVGLKGQVFYEIHIGTYTREGTYEAAGRHLEELV